MTKKETEQVDHHKLILTAATLGEAAQADTRLIPLATQALKLVIESDDAIALLLQSYLRSQQQPTPLATAAVQKKQQQSEALDQLKQLIQTL